MSAQPAQAQPAHEVSLRISDIGMRFGGLWALSEVSFDVERGSVVGLIGPNGSGKTTLMNVISGVYKPTTGEVTYAGRRIADVPAHEVCHLGIARTFQIVKPFASLSVRENVAVGAMYGRNGAKRSARASFERAQELLEIVGLARVAERPASELTIPDRKRLEVAKALALDPDVLLLDEVMAGLNATEVEEALELLRDVNKRGVTLIVVEHLMKAIVSISTTIVVLAEGKKIAQGAPSTVLASPQVIEAYLGSRWVKRQEQLKEIEAQRAEAVRVQPPEATT
ncbi:MAG: branched-chain amino acid transport system ATP-binding protein [Candidatus Eremiobacteraeota bacterium]|jgi:branched-chain amino acid transport system ATP-binding protein|nr:branched-chain amino acid transport system ATP-binding protein [Candidatus Eremiobacteraeota bacterium]